MNQETVKICPKCGKERHVSASGRVDPLCIDHMREKWNAKVRPTDGRPFVRAAAPRKVSTICTVDGCTEPRSTSKSGRMYNMCEQHRREYQREKAAARRQPSAPKYSDAQIKAGFGSPDARVSGKKVMLLVIDETADEMLFIEGKITLACPTQRDQLKPGGFDLLIERHTDQGYQIIRGNQPC